MCPPIVLGKVLGVFASTLTLDGMCPVQDRGNLPLPIQMQ